MYYIYIYVFIRVLFHSSALCTISNLFSSPIVSPVNSELCVFLEALLKLLFSSSLSTYRTNRTRPKWTREFRLEHCSIFFYFIPVRVSRRRGRITVEYIIISWFSTDRAFAVFATCPSHVLDGVQFRHRQHANLLFADVVVFKHLNFISRFL